MRDEYRQEHRYGEGDADDGVDRDEALDPLAGVARVGEYESEYAVEPFLQHVVDPGDEAAAAYAYPDRYRQVGPGGGQQLKQAEPFRNEGHAQQYGPELGLAYRSIVEEGLAVFHVEHAVEYLAQKFGPLLIGKGKEQEHHDDDAHQQRVVGGGIGHAFRVEPFGYGDDGLT